jgi:hypothetical protein
MNAAVFSTHILWPTHYETELEIIQQHLSKHHKVFHFTCNGELPHCELILENALYTNQPYEATQKSFCVKCIQKKALGHTLLNGVVAEVNLYSNRYYQEAPDIEEYYFASHQNFKTLKLEDYDIGVSILSSLFSFTYDPFIDLNNYKKEIHILYKTCYSIYFNTLEQIEKNHIEIGYVFNGRLSYTKAILRAFEKKNILCYTHERGSAINKFSLFPNHTIHNIEKITNLMHKCWDEETDTSKKESIGSKFFVDRSKGKMESWKSFTENQTPELLPAQWNAEHQNVVLFTSSEGEFLSIGPEWDNPIYPTQFEGIKQLCKSFTDDLPDDFRLYVRFHPNSADTKSSYFSDLMAYGNNKVIFISPDSPVSTYSLLQNASKIISFGSTMGMEAVFWGKISILLARSFYCRLNGTYQPAAHHDAINLIANKSLLPIEDHEALKYGYFFKSFGIEYQYYNPIDFKSGTYNGINLDESPVEPKTESLPRRPLTRIISKIRRSWFQS